MNRIIKITPVIIITYLFLASCSSSYKSILPAGKAAEQNDIYFSSGEIEAENFYYSDIIKKDEKLNFTSYTGKSFTDSSEIADPEIIGMSRISEKRLITSDRFGNINIYSRKDNSWELSEKKSLKTDDGIPSFSAFSADNSFICLYSGITDSIYFFPYSKKPSMIFRLLTEETFFSRDITDIDMESGYLYLIDTENRVSIIDYRKKIFETDFLLDGRIPFRSISVIQDKESSSLAALSPGSTSVYIYPMSEQYMMIREKGYIKTAGITSFNYGTHVLVSDSGEILYALKSSIMNLADFTKGEVTVTGKLIMGYPVEGGPDFLSVSDIQK